MNVGQLDSIIEVFEIKNTKNELGEEQPQPVLLKKIWANVSSRTGSLMTGRPADTMLSKTTHAITIRYQESGDITPDCFIKWTDILGNEHKFDIDYQLPPLRDNQFATIYVQEVV